MEGFFSESVWDAKEPTTGVPLCGACGLAAECRSPKMPVHGHGRQGILIVGDRPSAASDKAGRHWAGESGTYVGKLLRKHDISAANDVWWSNALICHGKQTSDRVRYCRPNMTSLIEELNPRHIICMGYPALLSVVGKFFDKEDLGQPQRWDGLNIPNQRPNCWVTCLDSPSQLDSRDGMRQQFFEHYLDTALETCQGRPWEPAPPDYRKQVRCETNPEKAAKLIDQITATGGLCSFDFETNMLHSNTQLSRIVSCAITQQGRRTLAYPWHGSAIEATGRFLKSPVPKVAANMKFEDRWCLSTFGHPVRNVVYDTNLGAHLIDNRPHITSVKFQAYALLGEPEYNAYIEPYFQSDAPNLPNTIDQIALPDLLLYNGFDAVLEYFIAIKQMAELNYTY